MANLRSLKKDVAFLTNEIVADAQASILRHPDRKPEQALSIIEEAVEMYNQLFLRINKPEPEAKDNPKLLKQHYRAIKKDLLENSHKLFQRIASL
ncbi:MAG: hypothetical protein LBD35_04165 [Prevotellaceae bacterium]|jgi:hypothetical protein|nr:hypothetical protein [Prevotellaceae bacterium]